jgi:signal transduction histidine kinase
MLSGCCGTLPRSVRRQVYIIRTSGARLLALINDVMDAAALRQQRLILKQERVPLKPLVDDMLDLTHSLVRGWVWGSGCRGGWCSGKVPKDCVDWVSGEDMGAVPRSSVGQHMPDSLLLQHQVVKGRKCCYCSVLAVPCHIWWALVTHAVLPAAVYLQVDPDVQLRNCVPEEFVVWGDSGRIVQVGSAQHWNQAEVVHACFLVSACCVCDHVLDIHSAVP